LAEALAEVGKDFHVHIVGRLAQRHTDRTLHQTTLLLFS
jgi:hypothetical protein